MKCSTKALKKFHDRPPLTAAAAFGAIFRRIHSPFGETDTTTVLIAASGRKATTRALFSSWTTAGRRRRRFPASFPASTFPGTEGMTVKLFLSYFHIRDQFWVRSYNFSQFWICPFEKP